MQRSRIGVPVSGGSRWLYAIPVLAGALVTALGYQGLNGQDAFDYLRIAEAWTAWWAGGTKPVMVEHPHGYPLMGALLGKLFGSELTGLRIISLVGLMVILAVVFGLLRRVFPEERVRVGPFVLLSVALSPFLLRYAMVVMSDVPAIALVLGSFAFTVRWVQHRRVAHGLLAVLFAAGALAFRLAVVPVIAVLGCWWMQAVLRWSGRTWMIVSFGGVAALVVAYAGGLGATLGQEGPLADWSLLNFFRTELHSDDGVLRYTFPNLLYVAGVVVHPGFLPMGLLLLPFVKRTDGDTLLARAALTVVLGYLLFIAGMPFQNDRVLLMAQPFVAVLLFPAFGRAMAFLQAKGVEPVIAIVLFALLQAGLFVRATLPFIQQARVERELARELNAIGAVSIYTHGMGAALGHYCPKAEVTELWYAPLGHFTAGAFVVVHPSNLEQQWKGRPPATNWERIQAQGIEVLRQRADGWTIGRIR
ncbi:MAG TPA: glycosyltransferase family 39 protein [Flavobacteriales bacterium]